MNRYSDLLCKSIFNFCKNGSVMFRSLSSLNKTNIIQNQIKNNKFIQRSNLHILSANSDPLSRPFNGNVVKLTDYEQYHKLVYKPLENDTIRMDDLVVSVFFNKQSTSSLSVLDSVNKLSSVFPSNTFLLVDSDVVPRSAYDADVQHFPSALLSYGGDLYRDLVSEEPGFKKDWPNSYNWSFSQKVKVKENSETSNKYECVLPNKFYDSVLTAMKKFSSYDGRKVSSIKSKAGTHNYTHGIDTDNLNLKRVGWPTE